MVKKIEDGASLLAAGGHGRPDAFAPAAGQSEPLDTADTGKPGRFGDVAGRRLRRVGGVLAQSRHFGFQLCDAPLQRHVFSPQLSDNRQELLFC